MRVIQQSTTALVAALLASCATAPRGPAATLANAGASASNTLAIDVDSLSRSLDRGEASEAFTRTWQVCSASLVLCPPRAQPDEIATRRHELANAVRLRGKALHALAGAYGALRNEADYDGGADLKSATLAAAGAVDEFASAIAKIPPGAAITSTATKPLTSIAGEIGGIIGEQRQRRRIIVASHVIAAATARLRVALQAEAGVFDTIAGYLGGQRTQARLALFDAGMITGSDMLSSMANDLDVRLSPGTDAVIAHSPAAQAAVRASVEVQSHADIAAIQARYRKALAALDALAAMHTSLEANQPVSVIDVERTLAALDASLGHLNSKEDAR